MSSSSFSFEFYTDNNSFDPYGIIEVPPPIPEIITSDISGGTHYRTKFDNNLTLEFDNQLITLIVDESGSMSWNDPKDDRITLYKRMLSKLESSYPGTVLVNVLGFGGVLTNTKLLAIPADNNAITSQLSNVDNIQRIVLQDSVYDLSGVRIVRRTDKFPDNPMDGSLVAEGFIDSVQDTGLTPGQIYYYGVWTFNKNKHYSNGKFISIKTADKKLPRGLLFASAQPRILPGQIRDDGILSIYNFSEGSGNVVFDSSGNKLHGVVNTSTVLDNFWLGDSPSRTTNSSGDPRDSLGIKFNGSDDYVQILDPDDMFAIASSGTFKKSMSINFWIHPYLSQVDGWIMGSWNSNNSTIKTGWNLRIKKDGYIYAALYPIAPAKIISNPIPNKSWTMITIVFDAINQTVSSYVNGMLDITFVTGSLDSSGYNEFYLGGIPVDSSTTFPGDSLFGVLHLVSLSHNIYDSEYIKNLYDHTYPIFDQSSQISSDNPIDNTQREVLLDWEIDSDFDYTDGKVRIMRKYNAIPENENDGDLIIEKDAEAGEFQYLDVGDFVNDSDYYYRFFTINKYGIVSDKSESKIVSVHIPPWYRQNNNYLQQIISNTPSKIINASTTPGNRKILLSWLFPSGSTASVGTRIYYSSINYPTIDENLKISDGLLLADIVRGNELPSLFSTDMGTNTEYIHRSFNNKDVGDQIFLKNGEYHFYTLVTYDRLGRLSDPINALGIPSSTENSIFKPDDVKDLHAELLNNTSLLIRWENASTRSDDLELFMGESALIIVLIQDIFGNSLNNITDLSLQVCTTQEDRPNIAPQSIISNGFVGDNNPENSTKGSRLEEICDPTSIGSETILRYSTTESGLLKGFLTHTPSPSLYNLRSKYDMKIRAQYNITDPSNKDVVLFTYNTKSINVTFKHPMELRLINLLNKEITLNNESDGEFIRGSRSCPPDVLTTENGGSLPNNESIIYNGGYTGASQPYIIRAEIQYKNEPVPDNTPILVSIWKHDENNPLSEKSEYTFIKDTNYSTTTIEEENIGPDGLPSGGTIIKSIVDIEIIHPNFPEFVDVFIEVNNLGFTANGIHSVRFISNIKVEADFSKPLPNGIDEAEQFATVFIIDPDFPDDKSKRVPVPDGTLVKWSLEKGPDGGGNNSRPFYSTEFFKSMSGRGIYSQTNSGVARNVFFGPVGNISPHNIIDETRSCCVGEEWIMRASALYLNQTASDAQFIVYDCPAESKTNKRFLMNADDNYQHYSEGVHNIIYADGDSLLKLQIAKNPATSSITGAECFRNCLGTNTFTELTTNQIIQIKSPGEIIWNAVFDIDPYTGQQILVSFESVKPPPEEDPLTIVTANVPLKDSESTDVYIRANKFISDNNPTPISCNESGSLAIGSDAARDLLSDLLTGFNQKCKFKNLCHTKGDCDSSNTFNFKWDNVFPISGQTTMIVNDKEINLTGGGEYDQGVPPIYIGFKEPLSVRAVDARVNGERLQSKNLIVDGSTKHTFVVEVLFANKPVPDGTPVEIQVTGPDQNIVVISGSNTIYTRQVNDVVLNPDNPEFPGSVPKRSLSYFSINPLPNISFDATINLTCRYDKLSSVTREQTDCIRISNTINESNPESPLPTDTDEDKTQFGVVSSDMLVYNISTNTYKNAHSMKTNRTGHFSCAYPIPHQSGSPGDDLLFVFGGFSGTTLLASSEKYNIDLQEWSYISDMPTARVHGQCIEYSGQIYCIGGLEYNPILEKFQVSRKIESYDITTGIWDSTLSSMPTNYGVAFGNAQCMDGFIYVVCGVNSVVNSSIADKINNKILRYDINNDLWDTIEVSDEELYKRITPFAFLGINNNYYIYSGSVNKSEEQIHSEYTAKTEKLLSNFRSSLSTNSYYLSLTSSEQELFVSFHEEKIKSSVNIPGFNYLSSGFKFTIASISSNSTVDISDVLDDEWPILPLSRDRGRAIYSPSDHKAYFMGGGNQNRSTTLNINESIDLNNNNFYEQQNPIPRGLAQFNADRIADDIYITGGITSGHKPGYININVSSDTEHIECLGKQTVGILVTLTDDGGNPIEGNVKVAIRGRLKIKEIEDVLTDFIASRLADKALGGDGSGSALNSDTLDVTQIIKAQESIIDPNSDEFQINASRKIGEQLNLFPVLFTDTDITVSNGVGGTVLLPRAEDPLTELEKLTKFIKDKMELISGDTLYGDFSKDELASLGDLLSIVQISSTKLESGISRDIYDLEVIATVSDESLFGQSLSETDKNIQTLINNKLTAIIQSHQSNQTSSSGSSGTDGNNGDNSSSVVECGLSLAHSSQPSIPTANTSGNQPNNRDVGGTGNNSQDGQSTFSQSLIPLSPKLRDQDDTLLLKFYNNTDWVPQVINRGSNITPSVAKDRLDFIKNTTTIGGSPLYSAINEASSISGGTSFNDLKKIIYISSDNENNLTTTTRDQAINNINSIDGTGNVPVIYTAVSTSDPNSITELAHRTESIDSANISLATGGQSTTLESGSVLDEILDLVIGDVVGGSGYGRYLKTIEFPETRHVSWFETTFNLPSNTSGEFRFRYSEDNYNFSEWSDVYTGSTEQSVKFIAQSIQIEIILTTGFTTGIEESQDNISTSIPEFVKLKWRTTIPREDFMWLNSETVLTNTQQVASVFEGSLPDGASSLIGIASSNSVNWDVYQSHARPAINEFGKTMLLDRTEDKKLIVSLEKLTTDNGLLYKSTYGPWDPDSEVTLYQVVNDSKTIISSGFVLFPLSGEIYFDTKQPDSAEFQLEVVNTDTLRVGIKFLNPSPDESIIVNGVGYIYSTNDTKPAKISQAPPSVSNIVISPGSPNRDSVITINYRYIDINGDDESGTRISWFVNNTQIFELENIKTWSNQIDNNNAVVFYASPEAAAAEGLSGPILGPNDLGLDESLLVITINFNSTTSILQPGDKLKCRVIPSDGRSFGPEAWSQTVIIDERPPKVTDLQIVPFRNGNINSRSSTASTLKAVYTFVADGENIKESGTEIKWLVNGTLFKTGIFSSGDNEDSKTLAFDSVSDISQSLSHIIGNVIQVEVYPSSKFLKGDKITSEEVIISNTIPIISSILISPEHPVSSSSLTATYVLDDIDILNGTQSDNSLIVWEKSTDGNTFNQINSLNNLITVPSSEISTGEIWRVTITPSDGLDIGTPATSNTVTIS